MKDQDLTVPDLPFTAPPEHPGFTAVDFTYHDGFALSRNGGRAFSIAFRHRHPHFEIFSISGGRGLLERASGVVEVAAGSLLILAPGDVHTWKKTEKLEGSLVAVTERFASGSHFTLPFRELTSSLQPEGFRLLRLNAGEDTLVRCLLRIVCDTPPASGFAPPETLKALLLLLFGKVKGFHAGGASTPGDESTAPLTREFRRALLDECPRLNSVKQFAERLNVSRSYLHRTVRRDTGRRPSEMIRERLLFEARRMVVHLNRSPAEIARTLGFRSAAEFSRFFKRHTGLSPRAFRSQPAA
jgi:AraC-like DNA-binding protein